MSHVASTTTTIKYDSGYGLTNHTFDMIHSLDEINLFLMDMAQHENVTLTSIGETYEQRDIYALTIGMNNDSNYQVIECGIHAREWISPAFCQMFIYELLYGNYQALLVNARWIIIPVANPDGYVYTGSHSPGYRLNNDTDPDDSSSQLDQYGECKWYNEETHEDYPCGWRKNRAKTTNDSFPDDRDCAIGVDLNRNHDFLWQSAWSDYNARCDETYQGAGAADQAEIEAKENYFNDKWDQIDVYFAIHSAADCIYIPYGFGPDGEGFDYDYYSSSSYSSSSYDYEQQNYTNHDDMRELALNMIEYMKRHPLDITDNIINNAQRIENDRAKSDRTYTSEYQIKIEPELCGWASGVVGAGDDWAKTKGATYAFTFELPPHDGNFHPPPHFILAWISQYMRSLEASYLLIAESKDFDDFVSQLPELLDANIIVKETFIQEHRGKLGFLGFIGLIGFVLSAHYGRKTKKVEKKLEKAEERLSVMRTTMMSVHPDLKHLKATKDPTLDANDNWEVEVMQPYFQRLSQLPVMQAAATEDSDDARKRQSTIL